MNLEIEECVRKEPKSSRDAEEEGFSGGLGDYLKEMRERADICGMNGAKRES
jgi:hypothetical protein